MSLVEYGNSNKDEQDEESELDESHEDAAENASREEIEKSIKKLEGTVEAILDKNNALDSRVASLYAEMGTIKEAINDVYTTLMQADIKGSLEHIQQQITSSTATVTNTTFLVEKNLTNSITQTQHQIASAHTTTSKTFTNQVRNQTYAVFGFVVALLIAIAFAQITLKSPTNSHSNTGTNVTSTNGEPHNVRDSGMASPPVIVPALAPLQINLLLVEGESLGVFGAVKEWIKSEVRNKLEISENRRLNITQNNSPTSSVVVYIKKYYARINEDMEAGDYAKVLELLQHDPCFIFFILVETSDFNQGIRYQSFLWLLFWVLDFWFLLFLVFFSCFWVFFLIFGFFSCFWFFFFGFGFWFIYFFFFWFFGFFCWFTLVYFGLGRKERTRIKVSGWHLFR
eukprot:Phypoly_transcript_07283.p1 GENE.Phypoly_transcript_07283~~Phypoly_transcript_07283.p1  ORF type:complete len:398 (+),score=43.15 Phypoly_transcript_07283:73-1266(+)